MEVPSEVVVTTGVPDPSPTPGVGVGGSVVAPLPGDLKRTLAKRFAKIAKGGGDAVADLGELVERGLRDEN